ncbi:alpha/beta-hydrolase [Violaceomyces palustris]|uniref:Alpha/beta-hydrolase n=1 Tax=Violaceomyces palustris TaxID=1673888 RepID=A0ACD0P3R8_9BASI|nr:alpha/beta-hydrolase [Violaceomyces palustris]
MDKAQEAGIKKDQEEKEQRHQHKHHQRNLSSQQHRNRRRSQEGLSRSSTAKFRALNNLRPHLPHLNIPVIEFPNQGSGTFSEFNQDAPIWARQPFKYLYYAYFGLSVGLVYLPWWSVCSIIPSKRGRRSWTWKKATMVKLYRHGTKLTFRTHTNLGRDLSREVPHSETLRCKFVWVDPLTKGEGSGVDGDIRGELLRAMKLQGIEAERTCGFWYGETDRDGGVGHRAAEDEKVIYHLHGGAYWIGTAHESDVTSAVNTEVLRFLSELYASKEPKTSRSSKAGKCSRTFSLDYRLCIPGKPQMGSYPAALLDAVAGYVYLVRSCGFKPENVVVAGDSAGGNLAIALCRYLRDEKVEAMPGSMLLMSPWADVSRSHSGPVGAPNLNSSAHKNRGCDIISPCLAFRNTAVSAFLGELPAREAYVNPYLSSISLQLPPHRGGVGPNWGFEGFPKKIYITSGSAEVSHDQHVTLAHRMAAGTRRGKPRYQGNRLSEGQDIHELSARFTYPRPRDLKLSLLEVLDRDSGSSAPASELEKEELGEEREVVLDEVKDAIHDYLLFGWFEPERSDTWRRIARWIDGAEREGEEGERVEL